MCSCGDCSPAHQLLFFDRQSVGPSWIYTGRGESNERRAARDCPHLHLFLASTRTHALMCACMYFLRGCSRACACAYTWTFACARVRACLYVCTCVCGVCFLAHARAQKHSFARVHTRSYVCMRVMCMRSRVRGYVCACACACERVQTRAFVRTCAMLHCPAGALSHANRFRGAALRLV